MKHGTDGMTRRSLFQGALAVSGASLGVALPASADPTIQVAEPAGPAPLGAPVESVVPFSRGRLRDATSVRVVGPGGKPVLAQSRSTMQWPDGSTRWLAVAFEAEDGPGTYMLRPGRGPSAPDLVQVRNGQITLDSGEVRISLPESGRGWVSAIEARDRSGALQPLTGASPFDLLITRHDGTVFRASAAGDSQRITIEERGPVRGSVRVEGCCRNEGGAPLFDFLVRWTVFRNRPEILASVTWINTTDEPSEQVRDIRVLLPFRFDPQRLVFGCDSGVYDGPFLKDWPVFVLQEDHNRYWAKKLNPDGRTQHLSSGGCDGEHCPGWMYFQNEERALAVSVPDFWQTYPNELCVREGELSVGLWPERAAGHLSGKPILPSNPDGEHAYVKTKYWPVLPHPYVAFFDPATKCLDAKQGMAKTQQIVVSAWAGRGEAPTFETKWWKKALAPVRGHLDPHYVTGSGALGLLSPRGSTSGARFERLFDECYGWFDRHIDLLKCYGKFDYGDFKYFTAATDYMTHPGTKWGHMGEMAREGYWHNNEGDPLLGLLLYYFRTADPAAWQRCEIVARHLLDVDIRHHPYWGMYTHGYGHGYVETADAGEPDHSWLLGLLVWAGASGDPVLWDWMMRCGERLTRFKPDFTKVDTRTVSVHLHMMCQFHLYAGGTHYLEAAHAPASALLEVQNPDGSWPAYMASPDRPPDPGFVEHAIAALSDYYGIIGDDKVRQALDAALDWQFRSPELDVPLAAYGLAVLSQKTGDEKYSKHARKVLDYLDEHQNRSPDSFGRGDIGWPAWGVHNAEGARGAGRPPQFLSQTRPLMPGFTLAYVQPSAAIIDTVRKPGESAG